MRAPTWACLSCGHFATDTTHLGELHQQRSATEALLQARRAQVLARTGRELTDTNVWVAERLREVSSLDAIIARLTDPAVPDSAAIAGAASAVRIPLLPIETRGAHQSAVDHRRRQDNADG
ncbi:Putative transposase/integrase [Mycobacteroides abscessus subsp. bolletii]|uniref:hypothetical protein n=1 Tax=Mycobacteroides abscessus TaxID=36809 RepID=UPI0009270446|nr:Putative transposase/integrase [Mycobacteroides abscessus subsp. bolletii]SKQ45041.1 Putative transposase/integrase [Mycobacteroides abscessus subsp. bolletii]SKQ48015.1 Putative transposase/integrase [Mycobacteroides abscessus subsp. bolletii]SKQ49698.1 Putative transposase/integrase [Mycobacteroides abscessus subsp. bolletii]